MREPLKRSEVKRMLGHLAPELDKVDKMVTTRFPTLSIVTPDNQTVWVIKKGAVIYYERHLP